MHYILFFVLLVVPLAGCSGGGGGGNHASPRSQWGLSSINADIAYRNIESVKGPAAEPGLRCAGHGCSLRSRTAFSRVSNSTSASRSRNGRTSAATRSHARASRRRRIVARQFSECSASPVQPV